MSGTLCIVLLASEFFLPLRLLGSFFHIAMNGMAASDKIFKILDLPEPQAGERTLPDGPLDVVLEDVHFSYEEDREILKGIDLTLPAGSFVRWSVNPAAERVRLRVSLRQRTVDIQGASPWAVCRSRKSLRRI